jgi:hypothetical protein
MIPSADTLIIVEDELEGARRWAERHVVPLAWFPEHLELRVNLRQPETLEPFFLRARFDDYRAIPPQWAFTDTAWEISASALVFPKPTPTPHGSSIFLMGPGGAVICVPFNRLAYAEHRGPHGDWGGPSNWLNAGASHIRAETIGDMLQAIRRDFMHTRGRMTS